MAYVENRTIHDADAHVVELAGKIVEYISDKVKADLAAY